jgi:hypothetical protein
MTAVPRIVPVESAKLPPLIPPPPVEISKRRGSIMDDALLNTKQGGFNAKADSVLGDTTLCGLTMLDPRSDRMKAWDFVIIVLLSFVAYITPYEVAFLPASSLNALFIVNRVVDLCFVVDLVSSSKCLVISVY